MNCVFAKLSHKEQLDKKQITFNLEESLESLEK